MNARQRRTAKRTLKRSIPLVLDEISEDGESNMRNRCIEECKRLAEDSCDPMARAAYQNAAVQLSNLLPAARS